MLPRALAQREKVFCSHVAHEMKSMDLGECNDKLSIVTDALYEELQQGENLLCIFIAFVHMKPTNKKFAPSKRWNNIFGRVCFEKSFGRVFFENIFGRVSFEKNFRWRFGREGNPR